MLNDVQFEILNNLRFVTSVDYKELADAVSAPHRTFDAELDELVTLKLVRYSGSSYLITKAGIRAHSAAEDERHQRADQDAQQRAQEAQRIEDLKQSRKHDYAVIAFSVALSLLLEHIADIVNFFKSLF